ncbi:hypothetical protein D3C81_1026570 [compost metagenome]
MVEEGQQRVVEAVYLQQAERLAVVAELAPGPYLEQFLQGSQAAGQGDEGVAQLGHARLARVHAIHYFQTGQTVVADLGVLQALRDDANDFAAGGQGRIRHHTHQAHRAAAIDQAYAALGEMPAEGFGGFTVDGIGTGAGAAEYADRTQGHGQLP